jgi:hypothetical protein
LIHDDQDPVGPQRGRLAPEQIHTPEAVFHVAQEGQPGGADEIPRNYGRNNNSPATGAV